MKFDTEGVYTLLYTAEDECGNETVEEREVIVGAPRTVLYVDGTFIINEQPKDFARNEALHGNAWSVYAVFDPNGATDVDKYVFASAADRPWNSHQYDIKAVEFGSDIAPTSMAHWFEHCNQCKSFSPSRLNTQNVVNMNSLFFDCARLTSLDLSSFNTAQVTSMGAMFLGCVELSSLDISNFDTSQVSEMHRMFDGCESLEHVDVSGFNTENCTLMWNMFNNCKSLRSIDLSGFNTARVTYASSMFALCQSLTEVDLSSFDVSNVANADSMFNGCTSLQTIYASATLNFQGVSSATSMFANMSSSLVGGAGTVWAANNPSGKPYARIDGGTSNPDYFTLKSA